MAEHSSVSGSSLAPRLMLNWHVTPEQTLRAGISRSFRPPSAFERRSDVRYLFNKRLLGVTFLARGNVAPEALLTRELGYLGTFPWLKSTLDVRLFDESFTGYIDGVPYLVQLDGKSYVAQVDGKSTPTSDYVNADDFSIRGLELQWKGQPWPGAQLGFNQTFSRMAFQRPPSETKLPAAMPESTSTLFLTQQLPSGLQFSLSHQYSEPLWVQRSGDFRQYIHRTDWRLSKSLRFGHRRGELAVTVQNQGQPYADFDKSFLFERRAFVTLRIDN